MKYGQYTFMTLFAILGMCGLISLGTSLMNFSSTAAFVSGIAMLFAAISILVAIVIFIVSEIRAILRKRNEDKPQGPQVPPTPLT